MKKILFLLVFCFTSTLYVSGQTFKSKSGATLLIKTSSTTWTLKWQNGLGIWVTDELILSTEIQMLSEQSNIIENKYAKTFNIKSSTNYVVIEEKPYSHTISMEYFHEDGIRYWSKYDNLYKQ